MPIHALGKHFDSFFGRLNPGSSFEQRAASEHQSIIRLIENASGAAARFSPKCYLQGSYKQQTAIYTINDVDIVARCHLPALPVALWNEQRWRRDELFETIAAPLRADPRYRDKVRYESASMCIKVDLGIKVEILPVVHRPWLAGSDDEPFLLYRPKTGCWENGYARRHQQHLSDKNAQPENGGQLHSYHQDPEASPHVSWAGRCLVPSRMPLVCLARPAVPWRPGILSRSSTPRYSRHVCRRVVL